ncbi:MULTISPECIES: cupin domain-containing protein [Ramlibacter]|nr:MULTISPECIES: cupin domain-containing protein [Ramlibacter]MBA2965398.1 cupin domain-containing protein [Ramlibacter sp. CGMCC 1.13660]
MHPVVLRASASLFLLGCWLTATAQQPGMARPDLVLAQTVEQMPRGERQQVRVLKAKFQPGDRTVFHSHRAPVTVYVLSGQFTLELEGRPTVRVDAGTAYVEPAHVRMTGFNRSATEPLEVVIFYVSDVDTPFLDPVSRAP